MLPTVLALCMQGGSPQTQIPKAEMPVVSSYQQPAQTLTSLLNLPNPELESSTLVDSIIDTAKKQIGIRYTWGGTSRHGFDCSGFVQYVFAKNNFDLPRTAREQWQVGDKVSRSELIPGDLIFFKTRNSRVSHVGIYKGDNEFIHASSAGGKIRTNELEGYYAAHYVGARRILDTGDGI